MPRALVMLTPDLLARVDRLAQQERRSRSQMLALLVEDALQVRPTPRRRTDSPTANAPKGAGG